MLKSERIPIYIGFIVWVLFGLIRFPASPFSVGYVQLLILAAPLWIIPLAWQLLDTPEWLYYLGVPSSAILLFAFCLTPSFWTALFSVPWLLITTFLAFQKLNDWRVAKSLKISHLCQLAAYLYLPIGAAWAFADRLGVQPMDFDATIVLLTVAHFHYAGFILPTIAAFVLPNISQSWAKFIGGSVILGIPMVAIGITTTHFGLPDWIELLGVSNMVIGGFITGFLHLQLGLKNVDRLYGQLWCLAGLALMAGMILAFGYGWRSVFTIPILSIPWMYAVHGTLNALGFSFPAILGWYYWARSNRI